MKIDKPKSDNYCATVIKIKNIIPLENCDNVVGTTIFGFQAIVPKSTKIGDIGIVFPAETQLSKEYCFENSLYRHSEDNRNKNEKGYIEDNCRVKAVKFRGSRSDCLFMPLESLNWTKFKIEQLKEGDSFDRLNDKDICCKFVIKIREPRSNKQHKPKFFHRVEPKYMPEHFDTDNFFRHSGELDPETKVIVSQKIHGCLPSNQQIKCLNGSKKIVNVKKGDIILGYKNGKIVETEVKNVICTGKTKEWLKLKFFNISRGDKPTLVCTKNHKLFTKNRGYISAFNITNDDKIIITKKIPYINNIKKEVLEGIMLGDGSLNHSGKNWSFSYSHKISHLKYTQYINELLGNLSTNVFDKRISGYGTEIIRIRTKNHPEINNIFFNWIKDNKKIVPENFQFTPLSLAIFYMDDGSLSHHIKQQDRACFAVCDFDDNSVKNIVNALIKIGFNDPKIYKTDNYNRIRLNYKDADKLFSIICTFVPKVMQYKLPEKYHNKFLKIKVENILNNYSFETKLFSKYLVTSKHLQYSRKWDIETDTHNFFANQILVHNSSIRVGNTNVLRKLNLVEKILKKLGVKIQEREFDYIYASRKVIKDTESPYAKGFYSTDIWTEEGSKLKGLIPENYIIYGELIGWTSDGKEIQKDYTYGIPKGKAELYVYRVVIINNQGISNDLSWDQMKEFCDSIGVKMVPELWRGKLKDFKVEDYLDKRFFEEGYRNCIWLGDNKDLVDEGVVVRVDSRRTPYCSKAKSPIFLGHESKTLDSGEQDLESSQTDGTDQI